MSGRCLHHPPALDELDSCRTERFQARDFRIDIERHQMILKGQEIHLTPKEFDLLVYFARNADRVLTHKTLLRAIWGAAGVDQPEYLRVLIAQLRRKIEPGGEPRYVLSEPWVGYSLSPTGEGNAHKEEDGPAS